MNNEPHTNTTVPSPLLRVGEVAELLRVTPRTVHKLATSGRLTRVSLGTRMTRFRQSDVDALIRSCEEASGSGDPG